MYRKKVRGDNHSFRTQVQPINWKTYPILLSVHFPGPWKEKLKKMQKTILFRLRLWSVSMLDRPHIILSEEFSTMMNDNPITMKTTDAVQMPGNRTQGIRYSLYQQCLIFLSRDKRRAMSFLRTQVNQVLTWQSLIFYHSVVWRNIDIFSYLLMNQLFSFFRLFFERWLFTSILFRCRWNVRTR